MQVPGFEKYPKEKKEKNIKLYFPRTLYNNTYYFKKFDVISIFEIGRLDFQ